MTDKEALKIYRKLQQHLDKLPIGYPATESGVELRLLEYIFTPEEAEIAINLRFIPEPIEKIYRRVKKKVNSIEELAEILYNIYEKGGIRIKRVREGEKTIKLYQNAFLAVGMFEYQQNRLTKEYYEDFELYMDEAFRDEVVVTKINQLRTIPIEESVTPEHHIATHDQLKNIINKAERIVVMDCICRTGKDLIGKPCRQSDLREVCFVLNDSVDHALDLSWGRLISKDEALGILKNIQKEGLIIQPGNAINPSFICCCCGCCCDLITNLKKLEKPWELIYSNYYASVDPDLCIGCETCVDRCQMNAIQVNDDIARVSRDLCIGCGNCVPTCPEQALSLIKKEEEYIPPENTNELYLKIMNKRAELRRSEKGTK
ncbi:MAG: ATP-binding protein [Promethearchaeota archaeon]